MSEDLEHHLEGALVPGEVRVYLYDARTQPLPANLLEQTFATLQGADSNSPVIPAAITPTHLSFKIGEIQFPCTFNLQIRFPGWSETSPPELFTFVFEDFPK